MRGHGDKDMARRQAATKAGQRMYRPGGQELEAAQATQAGANFEWHFGRVTRLGHFAVAGGRAVTIAWEEGGVTSQQGNIPDAQWEIFTLAFSATGQIAVLSDQAGEGWMYD